MELICYTALNELSVFGQSTTFRKGPAMQQQLHPLTCEGALQESPPLISPIRAAAVGLLELMRTGPLISMECR